MEEEKDVITEEKQEVNSNGSNNNGRGMAIASMVLGIVGLIAFALPCGILAIIFSVISKKKAKSGMATAGLVLGIIDLASWALIMAFGVTMFSNMF